jgi:hypothetical protein
LVALAQREFEKAGREFGEVGEEGGLGDWEGQVGRIWRGDVRTSVKRLPYSSTLSAIELRLMPLYLGYLHL